MQHGLRGASAGPANTEDGAVEESCTGRRACDRSSDSTSAMLPLGTWRWEAESMDREKGKIPWGKL